MIAKIDQAKKIIYVVEPQAFADIKHAIDRLKDAKYQVRLVEAKEFANFTSLKESAAFKAIELMTKKVIDQYPKSEKRISDQDKLRYRYAARNKF